MVVEIIRSFRVQDRSFWRGRTWRYSRNYVDVGLVFRVGCVSTGSRRDETWICFLRTRLICEGRAWRKFVARDETGGGTFRVEVKNAGWQPALRITLALATITSVCIRESTPEASAAGR